MKRLLYLLFIGPVREEETGKVICGEAECTLCGKCQKVCPENAIMVDDCARLYYSYRCNRCKKCIGECAYGALAFAAG